MSGADAFYPPMPQEGPPGPASVSYYPPAFYIDGAKAPTPEEVLSQLSLLGEDDGTNIDKYRIGVATDGGDVLLDPTPLGDITVVVSADDEKTFKAPVKALKSPDGHLVILTSVKVEGDTEILEWPVATFVQWQYVYRNDYVA